MGMDRYDYIIYGWELPWDMKDAEGNAINFWDDKFLPLVEGNPGEEFILTTNGESGGKNFRVFGYLIAKNDDENGWGLEELKTPDESAVEITRRMLIRWHKLTGMVHDQVPKLLIFSRWS